MRYRIFQDTGVQGKIIDNFFEEPDSIVEMANNIGYKKNTAGWWPGSRSNYLHNLYPKLFDSITKKITRLFYDGCLDWSYEIFFQKINPFTKNQYDKKNCGWIHTDHEYNFGGVIFLNKNPDNDTGINLFKKILWGKHYYINCIHILVNELKCLNNKNI